MFYWRETSQVCSIGEIYFIVRYVKFRSIRMTSSWCVAFYVVVLLLMPLDRQKPDRGQRNSSFSKGQVTPVVSRTLEHHTGDRTISLVSTLILRENTWGLVKASHLSFPATNLMRGLATRRLFIVPLCPAKELYIYKQPCLLRDSNPGPTAPQSASLTTILDG
ncbi:hypothetical protein TNCV_3520921 [Trichonephila clavipes]|nr:hypothetical protein TNCV_3520921 [Trichonephila clavipes]